MAPNRKQKKPKQYSKCDNCPYPHLNTCFGEAVVPCTIDKQTVLHHLQHALQELYREHRYLINVEANEVNIAAHLWYCFKYAFQDVYSGLDIDMEYNRNGMDPKYYAMITGENLKYAKPDMIIHKRGCNKHNFLYVEIKGHWNRRPREQKQDNMKLKAFTRQDVLFEGEDKTFAYRYKHGVTLRLFPDYVEVTWYEDGESTEQMIIFLGENQHGNTP